MIEAVASLRFTASADDEFNFASIPLSTAGFSSVKPNAYLYAKTFLHRSSIISSVILPDSIALITASRSFPGLDDPKSISAPAIRAATQLFSDDLAPFIANASVKIKPSKPILSRKKSVVIFFDIEAGVPLLSNAGTDKCPTITPDNPASIYCLNGNKSTEFSVDIS